MSPSSARTEDIGITYVSPQALLIIVVLHRPSRFECFLVNRKGARRRQSGRARRQEKVNRTSKIGHYYFPCPLPILRDNRACILTVDYVGLANWVIYRLGDITNKAVTIHLIMKFSVLAVFSKDACQRSHCTGSTYILRVEANFQTR